MDYKRPTLIVLSHAGSMGLCEDGSTGSVDGCFAGVQLEAEDCAYGTGPNLYCTDGNSPELKNCLSGLDAFACANGTEAFMNPSACETGPMN